MNIDEFGFEISWWTFLYLEIGLWILAHIKGWVDTAGNEKKPGWILYFFVQYIFIHIYVDLFLYATGNFT